MLTDSIQKVQRESPVQEDSSFEVVFRDGSQATEEDTDWSSFSVKKTVSFMGNKKKVMVCKHPVETISILHAGMKTTIEVPEDCEVYQAFRSALSVGSSAKPRVVGRLVGLVREDIIIEERYLDGITGEILGFRS